MGNLQSVVVPRSRLAIEKQLIVLQRLARPVGERNTFYLPKRIWQLRTRCLKVALHTYIHLSVPAQRGRIYDSGPNGFDACALRRSGPDVCAPRAMASLAIDTLRNLFIKEVLVRAGSGSHHLQRIR